MLFNFFHTGSWRVILPIILSLSYSGMLGAAVPDSKQGWIDFDQDIGLFAASHEQQFCLSIKNGKLKPGQELTLIWLPIADIRQTAEIRSATVRKVLAIQCDSINSVQSDAAYDLNAGKLESAKIYIAIVGKHATLQRVRGTVEGKLDSRGNVTFRACSSIEGLHVSVWTGSVINGKKIWHRYYYLGYDVEPTCKDADFKD